MTQTIHRPAPPPDRACQRSTAQSPLCGAPAIAFATRDEFVFLTVCEEHATIWRDGYRIDRADYKRRMRRAKNGD